MSNVPHTRVEYDLDFTGGDYSDVGNFAFVPLSVVDRHAGDVEAAFKAHTGIDPIHIVNHNLDEVYDENGRILEDWEPEEEAGAALGR